MLSPPSAARETGLGVHAGGTVEECCREAVPRPPAHWPLPLAGMHEILHETYFEER